MDRSANLFPFYTPIICLITFIIAYYACILPHEWGHGITAWLLGQKSVDYDELIAANQGSKAAIIAISGPLVTAVMFIISLILLARSSIQRRPVIFTFIYWILIINMALLLQYLSLTAFSNQSDVGRLIHGMNVSPWLFFTPGTLFVIAGLWRIFSDEVQRAYAIIPVRNTGGQRLLLLATLIIIFLFIFIHGFNPLTDPGTNFTSKVISAVSLLLIPLVFLICEPTRRWVKERVRQYT